MNAGLLVFVTEILNASTISVTVPWQTYLNIHIVHRGVGLRKKKLKLRKNKIKLKWLTLLLKSTKLLHELTIYLLIYVHACIMRASYVV